MGEDLTKASAPAKASEDKPEGEEKLKECEKQKEEYLAGWQRARADFLNYKKEEMERMAEILKYGAEEMVLKFLPILDNFEIAEKKLLNKDDENIKGFLLIKNQILDFLKNHGVEGIKAIGEKFDPNWHEVVEEVADNGSPQAIVEEVQKGYKINNRLLRASKVKINKIN